MGVILYLLPGLGALLCLVFSWLSVLAWREYVRLRLESAALLPDHTRYSPASVRPSLKRLATLAVAETGVALVGFMLWVPLPLLAHAR